MMKKYVFTVLVLTLISFMASCAVMPTVNDTSLIQALGDGSGVEYTSFRLKKPRLRVYAVRLNLAEAQLEIVRPIKMMPSGAERAGYTIAATTVSSFAKENDCIAAINAGPFSPVGSKEGQTRRHIGLLFFDGTLAAVQNNFDAIVFYKDGSSRIAAQDEIKDFSDINIAIGGFYALLKNGSFADNPASDTKRHPRSIAGLSKDGRTLYLLAIDGRQIGSIGATLEEAAAIIAALGAEQALNLDGGGSTSLVVRQGKKSRIVNTPIHGGIPGLERAVASCLGLRSKRPAAPKGHL
ncbi:MAG: hypothetical protein Ta2G_05670 [Termitinemataceae bacterium]|nr:MAG: hypothetical protein Ta2G_05670 [Termitinemataceae bacterium]